MKATAECKECKRVIVIMGNGLCGRCYSAEYRKRPLTTRGRTGYAKYDSVGCIKCGSTSKHESKGMCKKCYDHFKVTSEVTIPNWGYRDYEPDRSTCAAVFKCRLREAHGRESQ